MTKAEEFERDIRLALMDRYRFNMNVMVNPIIDGYVVKIKFFKYSDDNLICDYGNFAYTPHICTFGKFVFALPGEDSFISLGEYLNSWIKLIDRDLERSIWV